MQVRHGFTGIRAAVDHDAETAFEIELLRHLRGDDEQMTNDRSIRFDDLADALYYFFGYNEQMDRRLRIDVVDDDAAIVFELDLGGDFTRDDFFEDGFGHGET